MLRNLIVLIVTVSMQMIVIIAFAQTEQTSTAQDTIVQHLTGLVKSDKVLLKSTISEAFKQQVFEREQEYKAYYQLVKPLLSDKGGYLIDEVWTATERNNPTSCMKVNASNAQLYFYLYKSNGKWLIDIVRADIKQTLSMARAEYYLGTNYDWRDNVSKTLRAVRVAYQVQQAIETYIDRRGSTPGRLYGGGQQNDPLIQVGLFRDRYPDNPFERKPVKFSGFKLRIPAGYLSFVTLPKDSNSKQSYILVLYGLDSGVEDYPPLISGSNIIAVLSDGDDMNQDIKKITEILENQKEKK